MSPLATLLGTLPQNLQVFSQMGSHNLHFCAVNTQLWKQRVGKSERLMTEARSGLLLLGAFLLKHWFCQCKGEKEVQPFNPVVNSTLLTQQVPRYT